MELNEHIQCDHYLSWIFQTEANKYCKQFNIQFYILFATKYIDFRITIEY